MLDDNLSNENTDSISFTHEELCKPSRLQITEEILIHEPPNCNRIQTRSQTKNKNIRQEILSQENENKIKEVGNRNDPPDKERDIEENASIDDENEELDKNNKNQGSKIKDNQRHNK